MSGSQASPPQTLEGQVAVVTGAGQGIGRTEALELAARGARVVVNDVDQSRAEAVALEIAVAGGQATVTTDNVMSVTGGQAIIDRALDVFGTVHVVVNNAGFLRPGAFEDLTPADIDDVLNVHLRAAFFVTQPAWRIMKTNGYGRVIITGSSAGMFSQGSNSNYCAAKAGLFGLARALAFEGADLGIHVNVVLPFAATTISTHNPIPGNQQTRERLGAAYRGAILDRRGPELVAPLVAYLASPGCDTNGEVYSACAGRYARVFAGIGKGWLAQDATSVTAEDLERNWSAVRSTEQVAEPRSLFDEIAMVIDELESLPTPAQ
jgi:NAD(P)-dependent dehydrogenase (short-subunit alcohol dehydrogenase family)